VTVARTVVIAYAGALLLQTVQHLLWPQRDGMLAIAQVGAPHLFAPLVVLLPAALVMRRRALLAVVAVAALVGALRFGPAMIALPPGVPAAHAPLHVATWNLAAGEASARDVVDRLLASDAEVVALPELTPPHAFAIEASPELRARFPHRLLAPHHGVLGMGLLSAHPLRERQRSTDPPHILAELQAPSGPPIVTLAAHPLPPRFGLAGGALPVGYAAEGRDHDLAHLRSMFEHHLAAGRPVLVLGDLNVTDREVAYGEFTAGLVDSHRRVGVGPGSTWRPLRLSALPLGILRIDYVLTGGPLEPLSISTECTPATGDHCIVWATLALLGQAAGPEASAPPLALGAP